MRAGTRLRQRLRRAGAVVALLPLVVSIVGCGGDSSSPTTPTVPTDRNGRWQQDIDAFARELPARHPNLFFRISRGQFEAEVASLREAVPTLADAAVVVGLMRILALVGDSHTTLDRRTFGGFHQLPLQFEWFADGIFVVGASADYRDALGLRLEHVGDASIDAVVASLREVIPFENESWLRFSLVSMLTVPEVLESQGLVADASRIRLGLAGAEGETTMDVDAVPAGRVDLLDAGPETLPLYRQRPEENYWLLHLEERQTLYVQYRRASEMPSESFSHFAARVVDILDREPVRTLVVDLRNNTGGSSSLLDPLRVALEARPRWSSGEGFYTIIGRATFSSGLINAVDLKVRVRTILIGEPSGGKPNHYGEVSSFTLPSSGIRISYSTRFFRLLANADPESLGPDIGVELSSEDYLAGRDPVLSTILSLSGS